MHYKVLDEKNLPTPNFNGTVEVWEWMGNFIPRFYWACDYLSMSGLKLIHIRKRGPQMVVLEIHAPGLSPVPITQQSSKSFTAHHLLHVNSIAQCWSFFMMADAIWSNKFAQKASIAGEITMETCKTLPWSLCLLMMTSSNGNIFRVTGPLCGEFTGDRWIPRTKPVTWSFDVSFDLHLNKRLSKQSWGWWFETPLHSLWRHRNGWPCAFRYTAGTVMTNIGFSVYTEQ